MGVWDLKGLDDRVKKYLKLSFEEGFDERHRVMFSVMAIENKKQLELLKTQWETNAKDGK